MRQAFVKAILALFLLPSLFSEETPPPPQIDQLHVIFGASGYTLYKVLDFANDHGYRYAKIISYEFTEYDHTITCQYLPDFDFGRKFELKDENAKITFFCFNELPKDPCIIDLEKYRPILDSIALQAEN